MLSDGGVNGGFLGISEGILWHTNVNVIMEFLWLYTYI